MENTRMTREEIKEFSTLTAVLAKNIGFLRGTSNQIIGRILEDLESTVSNGDELSPAENAWKKLYEKVNQQPRTVQEERPMKFGEEMDKTAIKTMLGMDESVYKTLMDPTDIVGRLVILKQIENFDPTVYGPHEREKVVRQHTLRSLSQMAYILSEMVNMRRR